MRTGSASRSQSRLDESADVHAEADRFIESVSIEPVIAAGHFDSQAAMRPGKLLGGGNQLPAHSASFESCAHCQCSDPAQATFGVKERADVEGQNPREFPSMVRHENSVLSPEFKVSQTIANKTLRRGIPKLAQQMCDLQRIARHRFTNGNFCRWRTGGLLHIGLMRMAL